MTHKRRPSLVLPLILAACNTAQPELIGPIDPSGFDERGKADSSQAHVVPNGVAGDRLIVGRGSDPRGFRVELDEGEELGLELFAPDRHGNQAATRITVFSPDGDEVLDGQTEAGVLPRLELTADHDGTYLVMFQGFSEYFDLQTSCDSCAIPQDEEDCRPWTTFLAGTDNQAWVVDDIAIDTCEVEVVAQTMLGGRATDGGTVELSFRPGATILGGGDLHLRRIDLRAIGSLANPIRFVSSNDHPSVQLITNGTLAHVLFENHGLRASGHLRLSDAVLRYTGGQLHRPKTGVEVERRSAVVERVLIEGFRIGIDLPADRVEDVEIIDAVIRGVDTGVLVQGAGAECDVQSDARPFFKFRRDPAIVRTDIYDAKVGITVRGSTIVRVEHSNVIASRRALELHTEGLADGSIFASSNITMRSIGTPVLIQSRTPQPLLDLFAGNYLGQSEVAAVLDCGTDDQPLEIADRLDAWLDSAGPAVDDLRPEVREATLEAQR